MIMKKFTQDEFFGQYPKYSNFSELVKADILVMPSKIVDHNFYAFTGAYSDFYGVSSEYTVNCLFYSENQNSLYGYRELSEPSVGFVLDYNTILSSAGFLLTLYQIFKDKVGDKKFKLKQVVRENNNYYETSFEGNIEQYKAMIQETKSLIELESKDN